MDLGDMIRRTVDLDPDMRSALAKACEIKASALRELRDRFEREHGSKSRVAYSDVMSLMTGAIEEYDNASTPDYWQRATD
jgi:hypothetical protein